MWILQFLPSWLFTALFFCGIAAFAVTHFVRALPQAKLIQVGSLVVILASTYMIGAISDNDAWMARVRELEAKVAQAEAQSAELNTQLAEKAVTKTQIIRERGQSIVKYVDREVVKYDTTCVIPTEFITAHNRAAEAPKK